MKRDMPKPCAGCKYLSKGYCTVRAQMIADPRRERVCKMRRTR